VRFLPPLLALSLLAACGKGKKDDDSADDDSAEQEGDEAVAVAVEAAARGTVTQVLSSSGTVDADHRADVLVEVTGTVEEILVEEGAAVRKGAPLARLRNPQLQGELDRARVEEDRAHREHTSVEGLWKQGFVARNAWETAAHAWDTARLVLQQAEAAAAARTLSAPLDGTVTLRALRLGEATAPPKLAFQVVDLSALKLDLALPERELARLKPGLMVRLRSDVPGAEESHGQVLRVSPVVDATSGTVKVTVALQPGALRPGMFVRAEVIVDRHEGVLVLPKRAVVWDEGDPWVFVVRDGVAKRLPVTLAFQEEDRVEVATGLSEGDSVVVVGQGVLRDGAKVKVDPGRPATPALAPTPAPAP
jgi:RND family efflux transporter MFP subunit